MTRQELSKAIFESSHLTGEFLLRSGQTSNEYFDKYRFESNPTLLSHIAKQLKDLDPKDIDGFAALEMGGIPIATALSMETGLPVCFVRKEAKTYGTCRVTEGMDIKNKKLCIIEDVVTTGGQVLLSTEDLRKDGAIIENVLCVILRANTTPDSFNEKGLNLKALFTMDELKNS